MREADRRTRRGRTPDPLAGSSGRSERWLRRGAAFVGTLLVHSAVVGLALSVSGPSWELPAPDEDESIEVEVVSSEPPEPEPEPATVPEPPEPEPEPEPAPKPEPEPEPAPKPEPEPEPEPEQSSESAPEEPGDSEDDSEPESMDPVHLDGISEESTVEEGAGPVIKTGEDLESGEISEKFVGTDRRDDIETGRGDGKGRGSSTTPGSGSGEGEGGATREPKVRSKRRVDPEDYPVAAKRRGVEGEIVALLTVDETGEVTDVEIKKSLGYGLDELARRVFERWRFEPALENGQPVESTTRVTHRFELQR